jgi:tetratricopeptide (TPR) repeat protein
MNPNDTGALGGLGVLEMLAGLSESAVEHFLLARRLNPLDPWAWSPNTGLGNAYVGLREFDKALHYGQLGASEAPHVVTTHLVIATAQVGLGNLAQARDAMKRAVQVGPEFIQRRFETLESGLSINDTMRFRIGLMLTAVRLLDKAQLPAPLRDMLDRLEAAGI